MVVCSRAGELYRETVVKLVGGVTAPTKVCYTDCVKGLSFLLFTHNEKECGISLSLGLV